MATFISNGTPITSPSPQYDIPLVCNNGVLKARHQSGLPWGYTLLDYIESTGTQYIDTGVNLTSDHNIEIKFNGKNQEAFIFGGRTSSLLKSYGLYLNNVANVQPNFSFAQAPQAVANYNWLDTILKYQDKSLYWNGSSVVTYTETFSCDYPSYLFAMNNAGTAHEKKFTGKIYYTKIWNNGALVRDFIPAKDSNNVVGMYDFVSGQFFTNQGTGTFTAGSTVSDPVEIYTDGTVETINVHGKNLFDKDGVTIENGKAIGADGSISNISAVNLCASYIPVSPNTTYTFSGDVLGTSNTFFRVAQYKADRTFISRSEDSTGARSSYTFTTGADTHYIRFHYFVSANISTYQLELGSTATAEMLLKVGDYQDVQSIIDGVVTRKVGIKVLDGTENWTEVGGNASYTLSIPDMATGTTIGGNNVFGFCSHFQAVPNNSSWATYQNMVSAASASASLFFRYQNNTSTLNNFKQWLADQYAAGTPVVIIYPLATATTESVTGQTLQVQAGDNVLEITQASLSGLELEAQYQASVSLTIQEVQDANLDPNVEVTIN